ncbi:hypothetical protein DOTSEDRAFT_20984 [Dothistroma septosporum NZE10]|uniref:Uncharacterized protein n=1 Tax=Dothistroma septosporum (strain NZE10 / CBS 128990) TaxID=675120 RepID=N1PXR4_DOTSN|nr:hypothetical protein DOTSEDRAFT_20984 [Dothistroma septosporum NZE10]
MWAEEQPGDPFESNSSSNKATASMPAAHDAPAASTAMPQRPAPAVLPARESSHKVERYGSQTSNAAPTFSSSLRSPDAPRPLLAANYRYDYVMRYGGDGEEK